MTPMVTPSIKAPKVSDITKYLVDWQKALNQLVRDGQVFNPAKNMFISLRETRIRHSAESLTNEEVQAVLQDCRKIHATLPSSR